MSTTVCRTVAVAFLGLALGGGTPRDPAYGGLREEGCWDQDRPARIWPEILFTQAVDVDDYRRTMSQNRDEVRRGLTAEFVGILKELAPAGGQTKEVVEAVLSAVLAFDEMHDRQGTPDPEIVRTEALYEAYRKASRTSPGSPVLSAVEYLVDKDRVPGVKRRRARAYPNAEAAWAVLRDAGFAPTEPRGPATGVRTAVANGRPTR